MTLLGDGSDRFVVELGADDSELSRVLRNAPRLIGAAVAEIERVGGRVTILAPDRARAQGEGVGRAFRDGLVPQMESAVVEAGRAALARLRGPEGAQLTSGIRALVPRTLPFALVPTVDRAAVAAALTETRALLGAQQKLLTPTDAQKLLGAGATPLLLGPGPLPAPLSAAAPGVAAPRAAAPNTGPVPAAFGTEGRVVSGAKGATLSNIASLSNIPAQLDPAKVVARLRAGYETAGNDLRESLFRGLLNKPQYEAAAAEAAREYNGKLLGSLAKFGDRGQLTPELHGALVKELQSAGLEGGAKAGQSLISRFRAAGQQSGLAFVEQMASAVGSGNAGAALKPALSAVLGGGLSGGAAVAAGIAGIGVAAAAAFVEVGRLGDAQAKLSTRVAAVSSDSAAAAVNQNTLLQTANGLGASLDTEVRSYSRIAFAAQELGKSQQDALIVSKALSESLQLGGAEANEAARASAQLAASLMSGKFQVGELRTILETAPALGKALATDLGVSVEQLRAMVSHGRVLSDQVFDAILHQAGSLQAQFDKITPSIGDASTALENNFGAAIGRLDKAIGASQFLVRLLNYGSSAVESVTNPGAARQAQVAALAPADKARFYVSEQANLARDRARLAALLTSGAPTHLSVTAPVANVVAPQITALQQEIALREDNLRVLKATGAVEALTRPGTLDTVRVTASQADYHKSEAAARRAEALRNAQEAARAGFASATAALTPDRDDNLDAQIRHLVDAAQKAHLGTAEVGRMTQGLRAAAAEKLSRDSVVLTDELRDQLVSGSTSAVAAAERAVATLATRLDLARAKGIRPDAGVVSALQRQRVDALDVARAGEGNARELANRAAASANGEAPLVTMRKLLELQDVSRALAESTTASEAVRAAALQRVAEVQGRIVALQDRGAQTSERAAQAAADSVAKIREGAGALARLPGVAGQLAGGAARGVEGALSLRKILGQPGGLVDRDKNGATNLLGTTGNIASLLGPIGSAVSGVVAVGSGLLNLGKSLFGREKDPVLAKNNEALDRLRQSFDSYSRSGGALSDVQRAAALVKGRSFNSGADLQAAFRAAGSSVTYKQFEDAGRALGLETFGKHGRVIPETLDRLAEAFALSAKNITQFSDTYASQRTRLDLRTALYDPAKAGTPQSAITTDLALLTTLAPKLGAGFADLSGDTAAGRASIRGALQSLFEQVDRKQLGAGDLGQLSNLDELLGIIRDTNDALKQMGDAANTVSGALLNVPAGFKVALARFDAQDATPGPAPIGPVTRPGLPARTPGEVQRTEPTLAGSGVVYDFSGVTVQQAPSETPGEAIDRYIASKQRGAAASGRNPVKWAEYVGFGA